MQTGIDMTKEEKIDKMYDSVINIEKFIIASELKEKQLRKELDAVTEKVNEHEKTQTKAYVLFAVVGSIFITVMEWLLGNFHHK